MKRIASMKNENYGLEVFEEEEQYKLYLNLPGAGQITTYWSKEIFEDFIIQLISEE